MRQGTLVKLTLGAYRGPDSTLKNLFVRPVELRAGSRLSFVYRHATRDITKNLPLEEALARISGLLGAEFFSAHLFTTEQSVQLELRDGRPPRLTLHQKGTTSPATLPHDRGKERLIPVAGSVWLRGLGVTTAAGRIAGGMEAKYRQINRFIEVLKPLLPALPAENNGRLDVIDMGCGKGYLTFATHEFLRRSGWDQAAVRGVEARPELVELCNRVARDCGWDSLRFEPGTIADTTVDKVDVLVALHACDTATDDALARGIRAGASLILAAPCCHKELRPQLRPPPALAPALRHGILLEREAEFVTDALRAALLEWAGYDTKVFEFISPEHTGKNLMIAATKRGKPGDADALARRVRALAAFYGIQSQRLAQQLRFALTNEATSRASNDA